MVGLFACMCLLSCVQLFGTLLTVACQALLSLEFCLQEYAGSGCRFLLQGIFPTRRSNPCLLCLLHWLAASVPAEPPGKPVAWFTTSRRTGPIHS